MAYKWNSRMSVQGSVYWMAPEVIKGKGYSAKVDIWSLGCLALEMFTGQHPWSQFQDQTAALYRLGQPDPRPFVPNFISAAGQDFLDKCFTLDPELRPTAAELLDHEFCILDEEFDYIDYVETQKQRILEDEEGMYDEDGNSYISEGSGPMDIDSDTGRAGYELDDDEASIGDGQTTTYMPPGRHQSETALFVPEVQQGGREASTLTPILDSPGTGYSDSGWMSGAMATGPDADGEDGGKFVSIDDEGGATPAVNFEDQLVPSDAESVTPTGVVFPPDVPR